MNPSNVSQFQTIPNFLTVSNRHASPLCCANFLIHFEDRSTHSLVLFFRSYCVPVLFFLIQFQRICNTFIRFFVAAYVFSVNFISIHSIRFAHTAFYSCIFTPLFSFQYAFQLSSNYNLEEFAEFSSQHFSFSLLNRGEVSDCFLLIMCALF